MLALLPLLLAAFLVGDPSSSPFEVGELDAFKETQQVETRGSWVVHAFDSMMAGVDDNRSSGRYHLLLTSSGQPVQHGWWQVEETARRKFISWGGAVGSMPEPRVTLTNEDTGEQLAVWPGEA